MRIYRIPGRDQLVVCGQEVFVEGKTPSKLAERCGRYLVEILGTAGYPYIFFSWFYSVFTDSFWETPWNNTHTPAYSICEADCNGLEKYLLWPFDFQPYWELCHGLDSRRPVTTEAFLQFQVSSYGICGGKSDTKVFLLVSRFHPLSIILPIPHYRFSSVTDAVQANQLAPSLNKTLHVNCNAS